MDKFVILDEYIIYDGTRLDVGDNARTYNLKTIQNFSVNGSGDKWYVIATPTSGRTFKVNLPGTPYATKAEAITAKQELIDSF